MQKNFTRQFQQLHFNLEDESHRDQTSKHTIEINFYEGKNSHQKNNYLKDSVSKKYFSQAAMMTTRQSHEFLKFQEAELKTLMANQLLRWIILDKLNTENLKLKLNLPSEKTEHLLRGNLTKLSFYDILECLTKFGFEAYICLRTTENQAPGKIHFEF
jgi:hypothetical protein